VTAEVSPNRGTTNYIYDAAGNVISRTDARGITSTTTYDVLNRPLVTTYPDETVTYSYDACSPPYGTGKLCSVVDGSGTTSFTYGSNGRLASKTQAIANGPTLTTQYAWNAAGQLVTVTTPAGRTIGYSYANGRPVSVTINGTTLLSGVQYEPFGPNGGWTWGNGDACWRIVDAVGVASQWHGLRSCSRRKMF
jgi:YD repeat-containing protein